MAVLVQHLRDAAPWGVDVDIVDAGTGEPFSTRSDGPALQHAMTAMTQAYGVAATTSGSGGSIPLLNTLQQVVAPR